MSLPRTGVRTLLALCAVVATATCVNDSQPTGPTRPQAAFTPIAGEVFVGAGDIARCDRNDDEATAALLDTIPGTVFTIGDNAFGGTGNPPDLVTCYGSTWGRHKARTHPSTGHMEGFSPGSATYYDYFGAAAGERGKGYYSYNLGFWHIVVLNSDIAMSTGSTQETWLRADLAANAQPCLLAVWHLPRFSSTGTALRDAVKPFWDDLYAAGADVVLNAHYEVYERFAPQSPTGVADPTRGIRQFTVGTGGIGRNSFGTIQPNSEVRSTGTFGVLKLTLGDGQYTWEFVPVQGKPFTDAGGATCRNDTPAPVASVSVTPASAGILVADTVRLTATPKDENGVPLTGRTIAWATSDTAIATVSATGLVTGVLHGQAIITATSEGQSGTSTVTVSDAPVATVTVTPASSNLFVGETAQLAAALEDAAGNPLTGRTVAWATTAPGIATVDQTGLVTAVAAGSAKIAATSEGKSDTATVTVALRPVASVDITPSPATVDAGATLQLTATPKDVNGNPLTGRVVTWATSDAAVAVVSPSGLVTGGVAGGATITATSEGVSGTAPLAVTGSTALLVGAGDIAVCGQNGDELTANLLDGIPGIVFTAGDNAYESGTPDEFTNCYQPSWGRHKARTRPAVGNHEYTTPGATGYFGYFGAAAGDPAKGYYSYDLGDWHVVVINNYLNMNAGSPQEQWLRADLAASTKQCTAAIWHEPLFSSGSIHGGNPFSRPIWQALYDWGAEVVLVGHEHSYERFAPMRADGTPDAALGLREFVVGTGGGSLDPFGTPTPNSEVRNNTAWGVLELTLATGGYSWQFVPEPGKTFTDAGSGACHAPPPPVANPGGPYNNEGTVSFNGSGSFDPQGETLTYAWDFGDGATGAGVAPSHFYAADGVYTVTLVVTDSRGNASAPATTTATIGNAVPVVDAGPDRAVMTGQSLSFSGTFTDQGDDTPWTYAISWGDGTPDATGTQLTQPGPVTAAHTYAVAGSYTIRFTVTDSRAGTAFDEANVAVTDAPPATVTLVGAGDIARCDRTDDEATANLLDGIPGTVFTIGDNVFGSSTVLPDFNTCYAPSWGRHKARTRPAMGHMEGWSSGATTYYDYFGAAAGERGKGWYSYDLGDWHIIVLNSATAVSAGSTQELWLRADLANTTQRCILAIWHHPRFSSTGTAVYAAVKPLWDDLYAARADIVLNAHMEVYERFALQTPDGVADPLNGIRQFTVGTGGIGLNTFGTVQPNSEARSSGTPGVLKLTLGTGTYSWQFVPIAGKTYTDSGSGNCH